MSDPTDTLAPKNPVFEEAWHAQVLAIADTMVQTGHFSAQQWAQELGRALADATATDKPDTTETYYLAALSALEALSAANTSITTSELGKRKSDWTNAYLHTVHGSPVTLDAAKAEKP